MSAPVSGNATSRSFSLSPRLREERGRKHEDLLEATEEALEAIVASVRSAPEP